MGYLLCSPLHDESTALANTQTAQHSEPRFTKVFRSAEPYFSLSIANINHTEIYTSLRTRILPEVCISVLQPSPPPRGAAVWPRLTPASSWAAPPELVEHVLMWC